MENKEFEKTLDKAKELEKVNFKEIDDSFDHKSYYNAIEKIANKNKTLKQEEAENIIKEFAPNFINKEFIEELDNKKESLISFIRKYDPNSDLVKNMEISDVDKIYAIFNYLLNSYIQYLNEMKFNFTFANSEIKFLNKILTKTIEYNGDDVFNYVEFYDNFWKGLMEEYDNDKSKEEYLFKIDIKKVLLLHHLIKEYKVKGNTMDFKCFRNILFKIGQSNKIFNAYNIIVERLKEDQKLWGNALDEVLSPKEEKQLKKDNTNEQEIMPITDEDLGKK